MVENQNFARDDRRAWVQPELKRLDAGAAETGANVNEDQNANPFNARS